MAGVIPLASRALLLVAPLLLTAVPAAAVPSVGLLCLDGGPWWQTAEDCLVVRVVDRHACDADGCGVRYDVEMRVPVGHCAWLQLPHTLHVVGQPLAFHCAVPGYERDASFTLARSVPDVFEHDLRLCLDWQDPYGVACADEVRWTHRDTDGLAPWHP